jgi:hypothetical protein
MNSASTSRFIERGETLMSRQNGNGNGNDTAQQELEFSGKPLVRDGDPDASIDGWEMAQKRSGALRLAIFRKFCHAHPGWLIDDEVYDMFPNDREHSIRPRRNELRRMGLLEAKGRRPGRYGVSVTQWGLTGKGVEEGYRLRFIESRGERST